MKKSEDNIFGKLTGLDDEVVGMIADKYPDTNKAEIGRLCRKTRKKLDIRKACSVMTEIVSGADKSINFRHKKFMPIAASILIIVATVPGMYLAMRHIPVNPDKDNDLLIIAETSDNQNITVTSNDPTEIKNNNSATEAAATDHTTMPIKTTSPVTTTTKICSHPLVQTTITTKPIQNPNIPNTTRKITKDDIIKLSKKGDALTWSDFEEYEHTDIGSGLYIWQFIINDDLKLLIGGVPEIKPYYIMLENYDGKSIDIRRPNFQA